VCRKTRSGHYKGRWAKNAWELTFREFDMNYRSMTYREVPPEFEGGLEPDLSVFQGPPARARRR
jgi:hypothetical protein